MRLNMTTIIEAKLHPGYGQQNGRSIQIFASRAKKRSLPEAKLTWSDYVSKS
jgi:hypothetical protein